MGLPYTFIRVFQGQEPNTLDSDRDKSDRAPKDQAKFLMQGNNMKGELLGECLDSARWGGQRTVMYEMDVHGMIGFIQNWVKQNKNFQRLWHEREISELYSKFELPYTKHDICPSDKEHKAKTNDLEGRLRCIQVDEQKLRPSFVVSYETNGKRVYFEDPPSDPRPDDWDENPEDEKYFKKLYNFYLARLKKFEKEEPTFIIRRKCNAIISDEGVVLPLETILIRLCLDPMVTRHCYDGFQGCTPKRLAEMPEEEREFYSGRIPCSGHYEANDHLEFPFDGWDLAFYVQKWYEQVPNGKAPWFEGEASTKYNAKETKKFGSVTIMPVKV